MAEPVNEAQLVARIRTALLAKHPGSYWLKIHGDPQQESGIPDLLGCVAGRFLGIEVKHRKPTESLAHALARVTPTQTRHIERIRDAGGIAGVALSVEDALALAAEASPRQGSDTGTD